MSNHKKTKDLVAPPSYQDLKKTWYKKLKEGGFKDIEDDKGRLIFWNTSRGKAWPAEVVWQAKLEYTLRAENFLNSHKFVSKFEEVIWAYHCEGFSYRKIAKLLTESKVRKISHHPIYQIINRLKKEMRNSILEGRLDVI